MATITTFGQLRQFNARILNEARSIMKSSTVADADFSTASNTVFVSYSSKDSDDVPFIVRLLRNHGGTAYIDLGDDRLPMVPSADTARILKNSIVASKRLVVFVTTRSKESKWVPWELGVADGAKGSWDIALFPAAEHADETAWVEQEYLGLYRRIVWGSMRDYSEDLWMVLDHVKNAATPLREWLTG